MAAAATNDEVRLLREEIVALHAQIAWLKQQLFGAGRSETLDRAHLLLKLTETAELKPLTVNYKRTRSPEQKHMLPAQSFAHLPVTEAVVIEPEEVKRDPAFC